MTWSSRSGQNQIELKGTPAVCGLIPRAFEPEDNRENITRGQVFWLVDQSPSAPSHLKEAVAKCRCCHHLQRRDHGGFAPHFPVPRVKNEVGATEKRMRPRNDNFQRLSMCPFRRQRSRAVLSPISNWPQGPVSCDFREKKHLSIFSSALHPPGPSLSWKS